MKKNWIIAIPLAVCLVFAGSGIRAQVVADFAADTTSGCPPLLINFSDSSSGSITYRKWIFGNGNIAIGNATSVSATYASSGTYSVTLIVSDGIDTATITKQQYIHVLNQPNAAFSVSFPSSGCAPLAVTFNDFSNSSGSVITAWSWDFGDGTSPQNTQNATHTFVSPGLYSVALTATNALGCAKTQVLTNVVSVSAQPTVSFGTVGAVSACQPPLFVSFTNSSTGAPPLSYLWDIDGTTYTIVNPAQNFSTPGGYDVSLTVTDGNGCSDTLSIPDYVFVGSVQAQFSVADTVCPGDSVLFNNTSFGGNTFSWSFGDGSTSVAQNPTHTYSTPGTYTVTLVADAGPGCADTTTQTVVVENVQALFSSTPHYGCSAPLIVDYTDLTSGNIVSWEWHFGNLTGYCACEPNIDTTQNPTNVFLNPGWYNDTLYITTASGCTDSVVIVNNEELFLISPAINPSVTEGCAPLDVNFGNMTNPFDSIGSSFWDFGDGTTSNAFAPSHTFNNIGNYTVVLTIVTTSGCTATTSVDISVGSLQNANFTIDTLTACAIDSVSFTNLSTDTNIIDKYIWDFGDNETSNLFEPTHQYQDTGYMTVTLVVSHNGCPDTMIIDSGIYILGPLLNFSFLVNCDDPDEVTFFPEMIGGTSFYWNFDDSTAIDSLNDTVAHVFPDRGNYHVKFSAYDSTTGCYYDTTRSVPIRHVLADLTLSDSVVCAGESINFNGGLSQDASAFLWNLGFGFYPEDSQESMVYDSSGTYPITFIAIDQNNCSDTIQRTVQVFEPNVNFSFTPAFGCVPLQVNFTDLSSSDTNIVSWQWSFGDSGTSSLQNPVYTYNIPLSDTYEVSLMITDTFGCSSEMVLYPAVVTSQPPVDFDAVSTTLCAGQTAIFFNTPIGNYTYLWDFGDGMQSTLANPQHVYANNGSYSVTLTVTNSYGCSNVLVKPNFIQVQSIPIANFTASPSDTTCYPAPVTFNDSSLSANITSWTWNFGDDTNFVTVNSPTAFNLYTLPGVYDVTMIVETSFGCVDTVVKQQFITIQGPLSKLNIQPEIGCVGEPVTLSADGSVDFLDSFTWDFGDGNIITTSNLDSIQTHIYPNEGWVTAFLLYSDSLNNCPKIDSVRFFIDEVTARFTLTDTIGCVPKGVSTLNDSEGANTYFWDFGGYSTSTFYNSNASFPDAGNFVVVLIASNDSTGCADTAWQQVTVLPLPLVSITPDQEICVGDSVLLQAAGGVVYKWSPADGLSSDSIYNPMAFPDSTTIFEVLVTDTNLCKDRGYVTVTVQQPPQLLQFPTDTFLFIGQSYPIDVVLDMPVVFGWSPDNYLSCQCLNPDATPTFDITYTFSYTDEMGCFTSDTSFFIGVEAGFELYVPNAFTPNGDNLNDVFNFQAYGVKDLIYLRIYNRWGELVFETTDINQGWNGYFDGEIAAHNEVFVYRIKVRRFNDVELEYKGSVVLISK